MIPGASEVRGTPRVLPVLESVATSWLLVVCSMIVWSLLPMLWGWQPNLVLTGSMSPTIAPGDVVLTEPASIEALRRGRIVLVEDSLTPSGRVLHRIVLVGEDGRLTLQGDANANPDSVQRSPDEVLGVARLVVPAAGRLALLRVQGVQRPWQGMWTLLTLTAAAIVTAGRFGRR